MGTPVVVQVPFTGGLSQRQADEDLDPADSLIAITNGQFSKVGDVDKRLGMKRLPSTLAAGNPQSTAITSGSRLASWTRVDTSAYYKWKRYNFALNLQNALDRRYIASAQSALTLNPGEQRKFTLSVGTRF